MARENVFVVQILNIGTRSEKDSPPLIYFMSSGSKNLN